MSDRQVDANDHEIKYRRLVSAEDPIALASGAILCSGFMSGISWLGMKTLAKYAEIYAATPRQLEFATMAFRVADFVGILLFVVLLFWFSMRAPIPVEVDNA